MGKRLPRPAVLQRFGRLRVIIPEGRLTQKNGNTATAKAALCVCDCGALKAVLWSRLASKHTSSCGCLRRDGRLKRNRSHGKSSSPEYRTWCALKARCTNPRDSEWHNYGGRGISVCARWISSFEAFYEDMGPRPSSRHSIERYEVDGNYCPENCGWELPAVQASNKRTNVRVEYQGELITQTEAAKRSGIHLMTIRSRLARGLSGPAVFAPPLSKPRVPNPFGKSFAALDKQWGFARGTVRGRCARGWPPEEWGNPVMTPQETGKRAMEVRWGKLAT